VIESALDAGERRLQKAGFSSRSGFLTSPTFGGLSWLAQIPPQSGLWLDRGAVDEGNGSQLVIPEAQLLTSCADSPIVGPDGGGRAPDARGLTRQAVSDPMRLYALLGLDHTTLLHAGNAAGADDVAGLEAAADAVVQAAHGQMDVYLVAAPDADVAGTVLSLIRDADGDFARNYDVSDTSVFVIRPDGYLGIAARGVVDTDELVCHLKATFR
jgi:pentachlorophenol monooxygenase